MSCSSYAYAGKYPIKLMYTGNMPLLLITTAIANLFFVSQVAHGFLSTYLSSDSMLYTPLSLIAGRWEVTDTYAG